MGHGNGVIDSIFQCSSVLTMATKVLTIKSLSKCPNIGNHKRQIKFSGPFAKA